MDLAQHLRSLEEELLSEACRQDASRVSSLLAEDFREFGSSGRMYCRQEMLHALASEHSVSLSLSDFRMTLLAEDVALVTYRSRKEQPDQPSATALRSSLWQQQEGRWRIVFHQGTTVPAT